jgi:hypothetical protein
MTTGSVSQTGEPLPDAKTERVAEVFAFTVKSKQATEISPTGVAPFEVKLLFVMTAPPGLVQLPLEINVAVEAAVVR